MIKKIYQTIKKKTMGFLLAGSLLVGSLGQTGCRLSKIELNPTSQTTVKLTEIVADEQKPRARTEFLVNKLPVNSDVYILLENNNNIDFYKLRAQCIPIEDKNFGIGIAAQHVDGTTFPAHNEIGLVMRLKGKPTGDSFVKSDIRYFPTTNVIDTYTFLDTKKVFVDFLGSYNIETGKTMLRQGIDYKFNKKISAGLEAKFSGESSDLEKDYVGIRACIKF